MSTRRDRRRVVVALGGNALGDNLDEQMRAAQIAANAIVEIVEADWELVLVHGNGPQVGMIETAFEVAARVEADRVRAEARAEPRAEPAPTPTGATPAPTSAPRPQTAFSVLPMSVCVALSQGYIGYDLQNVLRRTFEVRGLSTPVATIITQVLVDPNDPAFHNPAKPIGGFMSEAEAAHLRSEGVAVMEDSGRGWRRVVASPEPVDILEAKTVQAMLAAGQVPIACGGGGIPVALIEGRYHGQTAVVDKDLAAAKLAECIDADLLIILTAVEQVYLDFGTSSQRAIDRMDVEEAERLLLAGQFAKGSMEPKIEAAVRFVRSGRGREVVIADLRQARAAIEGAAGTRIVA
ncbi:MAG: carbamate kinase [Coriobacteriales bacterium]|jgi:carbamate kinase|nr:carbamate kinase [Coriobacteriales bacterium]